MPSPSSPEMSQVGGVMDLAVARMQLQEYLRQSMPEWVDAEVRNLNEISAGWESDVYAFDLHVKPDVRESLVLRIYPGADAREKAVREFDGMRRLYNAGYPVPEVHHLASEASPFGKPFVIMERVDGRPMWHATFNGPEARQRACFQRFIELFVELHALDWQTLVDDTSVPFVDASGAVEPYAFVDAWLGLFRGYAQQFSLTDYAPVLDWLAERRDGVPCHRPAPIHWDYHPENLLLRADGTTVVIDWTQYEISDPRFDLAWTMTLVSSEEGHDVRSSERIRRRILEAYEARSGEPVEQIEYFEVFACAKRLASVTISLLAGAETLGMRPGAEAMMRRSLPALSRVYARLQALTGLRIPDVEVLFEENTTHDA
ncbi:MAG: phosphotransferase family protein [Anaerolineae bacterium]